jgi:hypothetical protein
LLREPTVLPGPPPIRRLITPRKNYNHQMARGWESKSVEAQQADSLEHSSQTHPARRLSPEEALQARQLKNLDLARRRVLQELESTQDERHRKLLRESLAALDEKLKSFAM